MDTVVINADLLKVMFLSGAGNLEKHKEWINELNVFPVPDGDTGTNMTLTIMSAAKEVQALEDVTMEKLAKAISSGSLRGARGNSGVILSQLLRGFCKEISGCDEITIDVLARAFTRARETAYKAVMKPKEGTILTVAKGMADKAAELAEEGTVVELDDFIKAVLEYGNEVLNRTPEMLPVLKEAGVVDSGGQGLMVVLEGAYEAFCGNPVSLDTETSAVRPSAGTKAPEANISTADIKYGYCTEFMILLDPETGKEFTEADEEELKSFLLSIGDSLVVVSDEEIVKVHVHTNDPGIAIQKGLSYGALTRMKIDNMRIEHEEKLIKDAAKVADSKKNEPVQPVKEEPRREYGFIAVSIGEGIDEIFRGLHVDCLISGGQTMNPSTEDMLEAIDKVNADKIFILPNNKNIILAAEQAAKLTADKKIIVIPSRSVPQGIAAMISFMAECTPEENQEAMLEAMGNVKTGQVTYAVRNTSIDGKTIHEGDFMGIDDHGIAAVGTELSDTALELLDSMVDEDSELISIYYGEGVVEEDAKALEDAVAGKYGDCDVELYSGNQPVYYYLMSVE
ncbi:MAG: DAK2 domain-containing protein [Lachnospiraceae bacterium]|nr:DAK2 domain-containing protein [Lachnospiraceae bacterium]MDY4970263.1 DAK2 domain-containing protein [Lachnospiraceae bacterium]